VVTSAGVPPPRRVHLLASYGTLSGRFAESSLPPGFVVDYQHAGRNHVALIPTVAANGK
jgi:hypothetical protein